MFVDTSVRSTATEIMDDLEMEGDLLQRTLDKLDWINKWLGGNQVTTQALRKLLHKIPLERPLTIVDVGCGSGDMLRIIARKMRKEGRSVHIIGIDANAFTIDYARQQSLDYPEIEYRCELVSAEGLAQLDFDIFLSTLFLHHFNDQDILQLLDIVAKKTSIGAIVNDLHRNRVAYFLFQLLTLFIPNPMIRQDGLTSILRGFKREDLRAYAQKLQLKNSSIRWRWAFRYQWVIKTHK